MYVFFKDDLTFDTLAQRIREAMNIPERNRAAYHVHQKRESMNMGGEYYLFEVFGLTLKLLRNAGEVEITERLDWPYYLFVDMEPPVNPDSLRCMTEHVRLVAQRAGLQAEVEYKFV